MYTEADLKSLWAYQAATARLQALREPDPSVCLRLKFDANGAIVDSTTPDWVPKKINAGVSSDSADELGKHQGAAARHLRSIHT